MLVDNHYKILREIGRGGTSCVYLAENIRLHNYWAIKDFMKSPSYVLPMSFYTVQMFSAPCREELNRIKNEITNQL